ncbi:MAG: hypothetical protein NDI61_02845 [Bdellovibrionaceae bacterium]|nr:hypothetical protein [Pseudobdellovibrionaceae bacterium]
MKKSTFVFALLFMDNTLGQCHYQILKLDGTLHVIRQPNPWSLTATTGERAKDAFETLKEWLSPNPH